MALKKARSKKELGDTARKLERTAEKLAWAEKARDTTEKGRGGDTE